MKDFKYVFGSAFCICSIEDDFDLKGSETDAAGTARFVK